MADQNTGMGSTDDQMIDDDSGRKGGQSSDFDQKSDQDLGEDTGSMQQQDEDQT